ncbi:hypothetical protein MAR_010644 [Mya arenaria]|uniref:Uncharacterized protein n=1 Tax=Mya arenaria TaxID=6604 RepID=A0ABY7FRT6_MYAAR|nr:hypothetical protein MAR_010644 [Mya arenaria]
MATSMPNVKSREDTATPLSQLSTSCPNPSVFWGLAMVTTRGSYGLTVAAGLSSPYAYARSLSP